MTSERKETDWSKATHAELLERHEELTNLLRDVVDDCAPVENNFRCICCGANHTVPGDGDTTCSVSKALRALYPV